MPEAQCQSWLIAVDGNHCKVNCLSLAGRVFPERRSCRFGNVSFGSGADSSPSASGCPLWVKGRLSTILVECPLLGVKQTCQFAAQESANSQKRTFEPPHQSKGRRSPGALASALTIFSHAPQDPKIYAAKITDELNIVHTTIEVHPASSS